MSGAAISTFGGSQPHNNMMPYLGMYWIIAMSRYLSGALVVNFVLSRGRFCKAGPMPS